MWKETNIFGVYVSPLVIYMTAALIIYLPLRVAATRLGVMNWVWNPPLAEIGAYTCILAALVMLL